MICQRYTKTCNKVVGHLHLEICNTYEINEEEKLRTQIIVANYNK